VSKRFSVTVPDAIGQAIEKLAEAEGSKPASTASFIVERAIKDAIKSGEIPAEWAVLGSQQECVPSPGKTAQEQTRINILDLQKLADQLGIPSDRLLEAIKEIKLEVVNGNR
jgi:hypothetical protein